MQGKKVDSWKHKLEDDAFAVQMLGDKNAAWEKLHNRLHQKKAPGFLAWRWLAAACLLVAVMGAVVYLRPEKEQPTIVRFSPTVMDNAPAKNNSTTEQKGSIIPVAGTVPKKSPRLPSVQTNNMATKELPVDNNDAAVATISKEEETDTPFPLTPDSANMVTAEAPPKKKLRVVHINDLGQPAEEATADNKNERHRFQLKIINGEYYNSVPASDGDKSLMLFQSKSLSN